MKFIEKLSSIKFVYIGWRTVLFAVSVILMAIFFFILNRLYPTYLDDWYYCYNYATGEPIRNFWDIIEGQYVHYFKWGGRSVVHAIAQFLLWIGIPWADTLNSIAYVLLVLLIYFIANKNRKVNIFAFILINILIWFSLPSFSQNLLWITGSANYLWGCLIIFAFLYTYISHYYSEESKDSIVKSLSFFICGVVAGWTNENMAVALIFFLLGLFILMYKSKIKVPKWMFFGFIGAIIGFLIMMLSPGNFERNRMELVAVHKVSEVTLSFYFYRFVTITKFAFVYLRVLFILYAVFLFIYWKYGNKETRNKVLSLSFLFLLSAIVAVIVMSGSPIFPDRAWFGIIILLITSIMILYANFDYSYKPLRIADCLLFSIICGIYLFSCWEGFSNLKQFNQVCERRDILIEQGKNKGIQDIIIVDTLFQENKEYSNLDLKDWMILDRSDFWAVIYGKYKGVRTIKIYDREETLPENK